jgi:hypothetical protein
VSAKVSASTSNELASCAVSISSIVVERSAKASTTSYGDAVRSSGIGFSGSSSPAPRGTRAM